MNLKDKVVFASNNAGKVKEVKEILGASGLEIFSLKDAGIDIDIVEDGTTFEENALIKCRAIHDITGGMVIADDSGLEIDFFDGAPGVYSARFLGHETPYDIKNGIVLEKMKDAPEEARGTRYVCAMAAVLSDGRELVYRGVCEGRIAYTPAGEGGFGYDPIFYLPQYGKTMAEITPEEKNAISHRGLALKGLQAMLKEVME